MHKKIGILLLIFCGTLLLSNCENKNDKKSENINLDKIEKEDYLQKGMDIAISAQSVLAKNLLTAINEKGTHGALAFCNEKAIPLTDSISLELNAQIKRVSDKNRNSDNVANEMELDYINQSKIAIAKNEMAEPQLQEINNKMIGYYPILTNSLCLKCHGNPNSDIDKKTYDILKERYPNDKAVDYLANELRGIWVISMDK